eukprot:1204885-Prymnesium_polylepis.1
MNDVVATKLRRACDQKHHARARTHMRVDEGAPPPAPEPAVPEMEFYSAADGAVGINMDEIGGTIGGTIGSPSGGASGGAVHRRGASSRLDDEALDQPMSTPAPPFGALPNNVTTSMVTTMLRGVRDQAQARGMFDMYGQIDALRPYFDVETEEVRQRLFWSFHPKKGAMLLKQYDLYSPVMLVFTLAALVVMGQKGAHRGDTMAGESTLMGTSLGAAFTIWLLHTGFLYGAARALQAPIRPVQLACASGYALAGVCAPLAVALLQSSVAFYLAAAVLGGCSAATLALSFKELAGGEPQAGLLGGAAGGLYVVCTLYLRGRWLAAPRALFGGRARRRTTERCTHKDGPGASVERGNTRGNFVLRSASPSQVHVSGRCAVSRRVTRARAGVAHGALCGDPSHVYRLRSTSSKS